VGLATGIAARREGNFGRLAGRKVSILFVLVLCSSTYMYKFMIADSTARSQQLPGTAGPNVLCWGRDS
jgi:hypothetical protein